MNHLVDTPHKVCRVAACLTGILSLLVFAPCVTAAVVISTEDGLGADAYAFGPTGNDGQNDN